MTDDFDSMSRALHREIERAFIMALRSWGQLPPDADECHVERMMPTENHSIFTTAVGVLRSDLMVWRFRRRRVEHINTFPIMYYELLCGDEWRTIAARGAV